MVSEKLKNGSSLAERFAIGATKATGSTLAFIWAFIIVLVWAVSGPFFTTLKIGS